MAQQAITAARRTTAVRRWHLSEHKVAALVLVTPALLIIVGLRIVPLVLGAQYSLTGDGDRNGVFVGLANYRALVGDPVFRTAIKNVGLLFLALPVAVAVPGILATFLFL